MVCKMLLPCEAFSTDFTTKWCVIVVGAHVICQVLLSGVLFATSSALMWCFTYIFYIFMFVFFFLYFCCLKINFCFYFYVKFLLCIFVTKNSLPVCHM